MNFNFEGEKLKKKLLNLGLYNELPEYDVSINKDDISYGYSYPIKAFEKFLGYYDDFYKIAYNPSISFNTDFSLVYSSCIYIDEADADTVVLDGAPAEKYKKRYEIPLQIIKKNANINGSFKFFIKRYRRYKNAKGMSESSAVASATARSIVRCIYGDIAALDDSFVSRYARLVSGSGTRAAVNSPSFWLSYPGIKEQDSFAFKIPADSEKINYAIFPKETGYETSSAHISAVKSIFYNSWVSNKYENINSIIDSSFDINLLMARSMDDMLYLNSVLMSENNIIQVPESISLLRHFMEFRRKNNGIYITGDTGPSLMVMSTDKSIFKEFLDEVNDFYITGHHHPHIHKDIYNDFRKDAEAYFNNNKNI